MNKIDQINSELLINIGKKALLSEPEIGWYFAEVNDTNDYITLAKYGFVRLAGNTVRITQKGKEYCSFHEPDYDWQDWEDNTNVFNTGM